MSLLSSTNVNVASVPQLFLQTLNNPSGAIVSSLAIPDLILNQLPFQEEGQPDIVLSQLNDVLQIDGALAVQATGNVSITGSLFVGQDAVTVDVLVRNIIPPGPNFVYNLLTFEAGLLKSVLANQTYFEVQFNADVNGVMLPLMEGGTYNMTVYWDWADGGLAGAHDDIMAWNSVANPHVYAAPGIKTVRIYGQCEGWVFGNSVNPPQNTSQNPNGQPMTRDADKCIAVNEWGSNFRLGVGATNVGGYFQNASSLLTLPSHLVPPILTGTTDLSYCFIGCSSLDSPQNLRYWQTGAVTNLKRIFSGCSVLHDVDISNWDTSAVTDLSFAFVSCSQWSNPGIGAWNTSNVTTMSGTLAGMLVFNEDLSGWDTEKVTDMSVLFSYCSVFNNNSIAGWKTQNVQNFNSMFDHATAFNQAIGLWNTSEATVMTNMFGNAVSFNQDIGDWNTFKVENMVGMFNNAYAFNNGGIGDVGGHPLKWNVSSVLVMNSMFYRATAFNQYLGNPAALPPTGWNTHQVTTMASMFAGFINVGSTNIFNNGQVPPAPGDPQVPGNSPLLLDTSACLNMQSMFKDCPNFNQSLNTNGNIWNMSSVLALDDMFLGNAINQNKFNNGQVQGGTTNKLNWTFNPPPPPPVLPTSVDWHTNSFLTAANAPVTLPF